MAGIDIVQRSSMIVDDFNIGRPGRAARPLEANNCPAYRKNGDSDVLGGQSVTIVGQISSA